PRDMSNYDEYQIVINEAQRRLIMRALTNAMANDRRSTAAVPLLVRRKMNGCSLFGCSARSNRLCGNDASTVALLRPSSQLSQQQLRLRLRKPSSNHRLRHSRHLRSSSPPPSASRLVCPIPQLTLLGIQPQAWECAPYV